MKKLSLLCAFFLFTTVVTNAQYVNILSVTTSPASLSDTQSVKVAVSAEFGTGSCILNSILTTTSNDTLYLVLLYQTGMLTFICNSTDTLDLGLLPCFAHTLSVTVAASGGTTGAANSVVSLSISCSAVGIPEHGFSDDILIYPASTSGELNIKATGKKFSPLKISILNLLGNKIYSDDESITESNPVTRIDVSAFPKGIYLVKVESAAGTKIRKFVKEE